jgi:hypothetical protein
MLRRCERPLIGSRRRSGAIAQLRGARGGRDSWDHHQSLDDHILKPQRREHAPSRPQYLDDWGQRMKKIKLSPDEVAMVRRQVQQAAAVGVHSPHPRMEVPGGRLCLVRIEGVRWMNRALQRQVKAAYRVPRDGKCASCSSGLGGGVSAAISFTGAKPGVLELEELCHGCAAKPDHELLNEAAARRAELHNHPRGASKT